MSTPTESNFSTLTPRVAQEYFQLHHGHRARYRTGHPLITHVFRPGHGWRTYPGHRRISHTWVRQARNAGITAVQLAVGGVRAEFTIEELAQP